MMKKVLSKLGIITLLVFVIGCSDTDRPIDDLLDGTTRGTVLRTVAEETSLEFNVGVENLVTIAAQVIDQRGQDFEKVDVFISFRDNQTELDDPENNSVEEEFFASIPRSEFDTSGEYPKLNLSLTGDDINNLLGLTDEDYTGGDRFNVRLALVMNDGRVFTSDNVNNVVAGGAFFRSPFQYNITVTCPVGDLYIGGYTIESVSPGVLGIPVFAEGEEVNIEVGETATTRTFEVVHIPGAGVGQPAQPFTFELVCGNIIIRDNQPTGLACGGNATEFGPAPDGSVGTYDLEDDSEITLIFTDNQIDSCGEGARVVTATLTKNSSN